MNIPLEEYEILHSRDLDEVRERVASFYCPHSLNLKSARGRLDTRYHRVSFGYMSFNYLSYGADVSVVPGEFKDFYMVEIPLSGSACINYGKNSVRSEASTGAVVSSIQPVSSEWSSDAKRLMVQIDRNFMERYAISILGHPLKSPLDFKLELDLSSGIGCGLQSYVEHITRQINEDNYFNEYHLVRRQVVRTILTMLLNGQTNNYSEEIKAVEMPGAPKQIQRAYDYIMTHYDKDISIDDIINVSGVSARSLFAGFKRYKGVSPMMALKTRRLQAVYDDLKLLGAGETITQIAYKWGFSHMGNFAKDYKMMFGELPSETIQKYQ